MIKIDDILKMIKANRAEFTDAFYQAQVGMQGRVVLDSVAPDADDKKAFRAALEYARDKNWLDQLIDSLINQGLSEGLVVLIAKEQKKGKGKKDADLQAITNKISGFMDAFIVNRGLENGIKWTGKVMIDKQSKGTGILIGPNLFLTAWHVVQPLFTKKNGTYEPDKDGAKRIRIDFEDFTPIMGRSSTIIQPDEVDAHKDWCPLYSPCHDDELESKLPKDLSKLNGCWDYAVIRLQRPLGLQRKYATLAVTSIVPKIADKIIVFQHPAGQPLKIDVDSIASPAPLKPDPISKLRFLHYVNAGPGSSGGPCFDKGFVLFGLHQGEWLNTKKNIRNRGIPITRILDDINSPGKGLPPLDAMDNPLWRFNNSGDFVPVLGLEDFQQSVWKSVASANPKMYVITGDRGKGKSFCVELAKVMLPDRDHLKIHVSAGVIGVLDIQSLLSTIATAGEIKMPVVRDMGDSSSTSTVWLQQEVLTKFIAALDSARKGRQVWLFITELNKFNIRDEKTSEFLHMVYQQVLTLDWLRVILDGMQGDLPQSLDRFTFNIRVSEFNKAAIDKFYRSAVGELDLALGPLGFAADVVEADKAYKEWLNEDSSTALGKLAEKIHSRIDTYMALNT